MRVRGSRVAVQPDGAGDCLGARGCRGRRRGGTAMTPLTSAGVPAETSLGRSDDARLELPPRGAGASGGQRRVARPRPRLGRRGAGELDERRTGRGRGCAAPALSTAPTSSRSAPRVSPWRLLLEQFENVLILILLAGAGLSAILGHETEAIVIAVIVVFAALLGFVQEYRAERALEALRELAAPTATVVRAGKRARRSRPRARPRRPRPAGGGRQGSRRRPRLRRRRPRRRGGGADRRVDAGREDNCCAERKLPSDRRSHEHGLCRHDGDPRPGKRPRRRDREPNGVRRDRADARDDRARGGRRCNRASTGSASSSRAWRSPSSS